MDFTMGLCYSVSRELSRMSGGGAEGLKLLSVCLCLHLTFHLFFSTQTFCSRGREVDFGSGELSGSLLVL